MAPIYFPNESNWYLRLSMDHLHTEEGRTDPLISQSRYRLLLMLEGSAVITVDRQDYTLKAGDIIFINRRVPHQDHYFKGALHHSLHIIPTQKATHDLLERLNYFSPKTKRVALFSPATPEGQALTDCILNICREAKEQQTAYSSFIKAETARLVALLQRFSILNEPKEQVEDPNIQRLIPVFDYIDSHLPEPVSLAELSRVLHISEGHFCRLFKQVTHTTPFAYINYLRVLRALELLTDSDMSITDISYAVGFSSPPYFNRTFRKYALVSPNKYRRRLM